MYRILDAQQVKLDEASQDEQDFTGQTQMNSND
jgi:hypothetical protein